MPKWDASAELMAKIRASIKPVTTREPLRQLLQQHFPRDCANLPIAGGWGYSQADAIAFVRNAFAGPAAANFVPLEYQIAQRIIYEELIIFRPRDRRFSGIDLALERQKLIEDADRMYDVLDFKISCWFDWHWEQLKKEWEDNDFGIRPGFDRVAHAAKRDASQVRYERQFWFDITEAFDRR